MKGIVLPFASVLLCLAMFSLSCTSEKERLRISTPGGVQLEALLDRPEGPGKFPAIVVAPGQGYHMRL